jgi:hypothetical protein
VTSCFKDALERHDRATLVNTLDSLTGIPPHIVKMKSSSKKTDSYRKRAKEIDKRLKAQLKRSIGMAMVVADLARALSAVLRPAR